MSERSEVRAAPEDPSTGSPRRPVLLLGAVAALLALLLVVAVLTLPAPEGGADRAGTSSASTAGDGADEDGADDDAREDGAADDGARDLHGRLRGGLRVDAGVPVAEETRLTRYPDAGEVGIPARLGWRGGELPPCTSGGGSVRAVMLQDVEGEVRALLLQGRSGYCRLPLVLTPPRGADLATMLVQAVSRDRRSVALVGDRRVVVVSLRGPRLEVRTTLVPDPGLQRAGWSIDGTRVLVVGDGTWTLAPGDRTARRAAADDGPGRYRLVDDDGLARVELDGRGRALGRSLLDPTSTWGVRGGDVANIEGWSAATVAPTGEVADLVGSRHGVVAVQVDVSPRPVVYARAEGDGPALPLAWLPLQRLVLSSGTEGARRLLVWDPVHGRAWGLSDVDPQVIALGL